MAGAGGGTVTASGSRAPTTPRPESRTPSAYKGGVSPQDIAIVGYDTWDTMVLASRPPFTSVDVDLTETGRVAAPRLLQAIDADARAGIHTVPGRLVVRDST